MVDGGGAIPGGDTIPGIGGAGARVGDDGASSRFNGTSFPTASFGTEGTDIPGGPVGGGATFDKPTVAFSSTSYSSSNKLSTKSLVIFSPSASNCAVCFLVCSACRKSSVSCIAENLESASDHASFPLALEEEEVEVGFGFDVVLFLDVDGCVGVGPTTPAPPTIKDPAVGGAVKNPGGALGAEEDSDDIPGGGGALPPLLPPVVLVALSNSRSKFNSFCTMASSAVVLSVGNNESFVSVPVPDDPMSERRSLMRDPPKLERTSSSMVTNPQLLVNNT